jgi:hypothetical protein
MDAGGDVTMSDVNDEGFQKVPSTRGRCRIPPTIITTLTRRPNSFAVLGTSPGDDSPEPPGESPVPPTTRALPDGACGVSPPTPLSLQAFITADVAEW